MLEQDAPESGAPDNHATVWEAISDAIPDADALVQGDRHVAWRALDDRAARLAGAFASLGVGAGTHTALYLRNCPEYVESLAACLKLRAVAANVNPLYLAREVAQIVDNADAEVVVYHRSLGAHVAAALPSLPRVHAIVEVDDGSDAPPVDGALRFEELIATHDPAPRIPRSGTDHLLWYTGGTTGTPKGVLWEQQTLLRSGYTYGTGLLGRDAPATVAEAARAATALDEEDRRLVTLVTTPLAHATAANQLHLTLAHGGTLVLLPVGPVDGDAICRTVEREHVRLLSIVGTVVLPRIVTALLRADERGSPYDISSLWRVHASGAISSAAAKDALHRYAPQVSFYDALGASEGVGFGVSLTTTVGEASTARFRLGPNARVLDSDDRDVVPGSGEPGVLAVTESTGIGYHKDPERTAATFRLIDGRRYAVLGDWAVLHTDGTITLLGRGSGCINTGGEKVWPEEVEEALKTHPAVVDAVVVGLPDEEWGESIAAVVSLRDGDTATDDGSPDVPGTGDPSPGELGEWVATRLARYKRPRRVEIVDEVVRTPVGKPDYEWARAQLN